MNLWFLVINFSSAGLGVLKLVIAAYFLNKVNFGLYSGALGLSALSAAIVSFGLIEFTIKKYPRFWVEKKYKDIIDFSLHIIKKISSRIIVLGLILLTFITLTGYKISLLVVIVCLLFVFMICCISIVAAMLRAPASYVALQRFAIARGVIPLTFVALALSYGDWVLLIFGEIVASILVCIIGYVIYQQETKKNISKKSVVPENDTTVNDNGGYYIYSARLLSSSLSLGDRAFVGMLAGPAVAGSYAILALLPQIGLLVSGVICQKLGAEVVKIQHLRKPFEAVKKIIITAVLVQFFMAAIVAALISITYSLSDYIGLSERFNFSIVGLSIAISIVLFQFFTILEYVIISNNHERLLLQSSTAAAVVGYSSLTLMIHLDVNFEYFLLAILLARIMQTAILFYNLKKCNCVESK